MKRVSKVCPCGKAFDHVASEDFSLCRKCRQKISNQKAAPKYYASHKEELALKRRDKHYKCRYDDHRGGVTVQYHGCANEDHMSKSMFMRNMGAFEVGDQYKLDGVWYEVGLDK